MSKTKLPGATHIGTVELAALDVPRVTAFYRDRIGVTESALRIVPATSARPRVATGLYHTAFLYASRAHLARALRKLIAERVPLQGASDHLVSEAIYFADPEGNGIEIYADRPRETWRALDDSLRMGTQPLDVQNLLAEPDPAGHEAPRVGHVHLKVADVRAAEAFYRDIIGFDVMASMGAQASFVSAGGYHHHLGMNAWESRGAPMPPDGAAGLSRYEIVVPDRAALDALFERLKDAKHGFVREADHSIRTGDPSGNRLLVRVTGSEAE